MRETALCLRALFTLAGSPAAAKLRDPDVRRSLADESLRFVEVIHVRDPFQRQGLLTPLLENFLTLLGRLPEWFAFRGNCVSVPGMPDNAAGRAGWKRAGLGEGEVKERLTRVYEGLW